MEAAVQAGIETYRSTLWALNVMYFAMMFLAVERFADNFNKERWGWVIPNGLLVVLLLWGIFK